MSSVTHRISQVKQPSGGYLPMKYFTKEIFNDGTLLNEKESIHASLVGMAVDYLTRFSLGDSVEKAFHISFLGAHNVGLSATAEELKKDITGLDDLSIICACNLVRFDVFYRSSSRTSIPTDFLTPSHETIENIRVMVKRSMEFWKKYGPVVSSELTFEGGYTDTVNTGDGDFLTSDTLWDFKVSKSNPTTKHSLQLLVYYVMGLHSVHSHFQSVTKLGFFNPRLNIAYICPVSSIPPETILEIENDVLCYGVYFPVTNSSSTENLIPRRKIELSSLEEEPEMVTVADICDMSNLRKSVVYDDIHSGVLSAHKKGTKYLVDRTHALEYIERKKLQQTILLVVSLSTVVIMMIFMVFILLEALK